MSVLSKENRIHLAYARSYQRALLIKKALGRDRDILHIAQSKGAGGQGDGLTRYLIFFRHRYLIFFPRRKFIVAVFKKFAMIYLYNNNNIGISRMQV